MAENLLCKDHKATTPAFRDGWDRTFGPIWGQIICYKSVGYRVVIEKALITEISEIEEKQ